MRIRHLFLMLCVLFYFLPLSFAQAQRPIVRLIYFLPRDRAPQPDIDAKMDKLIKDVQQAYAGIMEGHGFGRKTFEFETDARGNAVVHHIKGQFTDKHYSNLSSTWDIWEEIDPRFEALRNIYLTAIDISNETINKGLTCGLGGPWGKTGGRVLIPASGPCFNIHVTAHELGHAFGLHHDLRGDAQRVLSHTSDWMVTSFCAAEWLDAHRAFNAEQLPFNENDSTRIQMLPPNFVSPPNVIRFRFKVTDPDGLHQVQLLMAADDGSDLFGYGSNLLLGCKRVSGNLNRTVEIDTHYLRLHSSSVSLCVIDTHGNLFWSESYPINVPSLLPRAKVVSIPDANLATAVRREIGNAITTHTMLNLTSLDVRNRGITHLTGLEHAYNLNFLKLGNEYIDGTGYVNSNAVSDVSPLSGLNQLTYLSLSNNTITDISPLSGLNQLTYLSLSNNTITDVSPLSGLNQLTYLSLSNNTITDVAPLAELTQLTQLHLVDNSIADVSPLVALNLTGTEWDNTGLYLYNNPLSYASINTHIRAMQAKGIVVKFDNRAYPTLLKISGDGQEGLAGHILAAPFIVELQDERGQPKPDVVVTFAIDTGGGLLNPATAKTDADGKARTTLILGWTPGTTTLRAMTRSVKSYVRFTATATVLADRVDEDVNGDGSVDVKDLVFVAASFSAVPIPGVLPDTDVNNDGEVNDEDVALVLAALAAGTTAPAVMVQPSAVWTAEHLQGWIAEANRLRGGDVIFQRGIAVLEQLLADLLPKETALLPNYPNPFNPETWIPYQLAAPADVKLHIYSVKGALVRRLALGHQAAGRYHNKSRAAYWNGRNEHGEAVASGVYLYTLSAGDFKATRKMLIQK